MSLKQALIVAQVIPQWYVDVLTGALGQDWHIDIITGSDVQGNVIPSPKHDAESLKSRLICWYKHWSFMKDWMRRNRERNYDLIFAISNPPINSYIGLKLKKQFHAPFVYMNWDLYPQVIEQSIASPVAKLACKAWNGWNKRNYPKIDRMLTIGEVMAQSLVKPLTRDITVEVLPVSVDTDRLKPVPKTENPFCIAHGLTDKFVVLYSGKMGIGHNIEVILEASRLLREENDIVFVFIGNGPKHRMVEEFITRERAENVQLYPLQSDEMFPYSMACGDVGIVTQEASMAHLFMPSKTYSMMACGLAILGICTENDDLHSLLEDGKFGIAATSVTAERLADQILSLYNQPQKVSIMKAAARSAACEKYDNRKMQLRYGQLFETMAG